MWQLGLVGFRGACQHEAPPAAGIYKDRRAAVAGGTAVPLGAGVASVGALKGSSYVDKFPT